MKKAVFILSAFIFSFCSLHAQKVEVITKNKPGWSKIGETSVDFKIDKDVIKLFGADAFKSIKIKATDAPVHIDALQVIYADGEPQNVPVRYDFKVGEESRAIDLNGGQRKVKEIDLVYRTVPNYKEDKAHIEIYGLK